MTDTNADNIFNIKEVLEVNKNTLTEYFWWLKRYVGSKQYIKNPLLNKEDKEKYKERFNSAKNTIEKLKTLYFSEYTPKLKQFIDSSNIRSDYKTILKYRYLGGWKWQRIIKWFYGEKEDYEYEPEKYKDKIMCKHKQALRILQKEIFKNDDIAAYEFIANTIFDNESINKSFNKNYKHTQIYKYLLSKHRKKSNVNIKNTKIV